MISLTFYLYAILGVEVFRENDPWHFRDFFFAMATPFRMATLEDWTNVLYVNFYGCGTFTDTGLYILPNATCAIVQDCDKYLAAPGDFSDPLVTPAACLVDPAGARVAACVLQRCYYPPERGCHSPSPSKLASSPYFVTYITISALVMFSNISSSSSSSSSSDGGAAAPVSQPRLPARLALLVRNQ